jgi:beta-lactamase superfamily II metal-dependent hydrolase
MLPAGPGDALVVEYGDGPTTHRVLVDGGTPPTHRAIRDVLAALPDQESMLELFVLTHVDTDHIGGVLKLLSPVPKGMEVRDFWFNERRHLEPASILGPVDGEILGVFLDRLPWTWNGVFQPEGKRGNFPVMIPDRPGAAPPCFELEGGMSITLLSPGPTEVTALQKAWAKELDTKKLDPSADDFAERLSEQMHRRGVEPPSLLGEEDAMTVDELAAQRFTEDPSPANGSSIAMLLEHNERSCLLTGDAVPSAMLPPIRALLRERRQTKLRVDAVKLPHHGSRNNVSPELVDVLDSPRWLFSTNGAQHDHPDPQAVARVIRPNRGRGVRLCFNYPKEVNLNRLRRWDAPASKEDWGYVTEFAPDPTGGLTLDLEAEP